MNANELRIGNLVYRTNKLTKEKILIELTASDILDVSANGEMSYFIYKTIPLTEEWLFEFGFLNFGYRYSKPELKLDIIKGDGYYLSNVSKEIEYVHKLQNLYFALTNKELEINI